MASIDADQLFGQPVPLDPTLPWPEIKARAVEALGQSKDFRLLTYLAAALLRTDGLLPFLDTLGVASRWLAAQLGRGLPADRRGCDRPPQRAERVCRSARGARRASACAAREQPAARPLQLPRCRDGVGAGAAGRGRGGARPAPDRLGVRLRAARQPGGGAAGPGCGDDRAQGDRRAHAVRGRVGGGAGGGAPPDAAGQDGHRRPKAVGRASGRGGSRRGGAPRARGMPHRLAGRPRSVPSAIGRTRSGRWRR